ncbi:hypothetical protein AWB69_07168 [Caballeronia udeis]|uniref:Uncharacterized protein n=1 Tax=Caballeronia udeis TaxID=1232866 RepID=A0A158J4Q9_9BURK|nr:hypothetical protein AWB69_07168 [Caballeronia udeis]
MRDRPERSYEAVTGPEAADHQGLTMTEICARADVALVILPNGSRHRFTRLQ